MIETIDVCLEVPVDCSLDLFYGDTCAWRVGDVDESPQSKVRLLMSHDVFRTKFACI